MGHLTAERVFLGGGFVIAAWKGNAGDFKRWSVPEPVKRKDFASASIICRGMFGYPHLPDRSAVPGDLVNEVMPDWDAPGKYDWTAMRDDSLELCATTCDAMGDQQRADFNCWKVVGQVEVPAGAVLVIATGAAHLEGGTGLISPHICHAKRGPMRVRLLGVGAIYRRI